MRQDSQSEEVVDLVYYGIKGGVSMKKFILVGLVLAFTLAVVGFKGPSFMDVIEYASIQPLIF